MQVFYGILAMMVLGILSLTMNRSIYGTETQMVVNEYSTQMTGIAGEVLDQVGSLPYDAITLSGIIVKTTSALSDPILGAPACSINKDTAVDQYFKGCLAMNDLHGKNGTRMVGGLPFDVEVRMWYVDNAGNKLTSGTSFKKEVRVLVKTGDLRVGANNDSLKIEVFRTFSYPRVIG
jgi:hypothetical protein